MTDNLYKNKLSTGNPFLDKIFEGGFQLGSIILLYEDSALKLYQNFIKYILSDGIVSNNKILYYYGNKNSFNEIFNNLPYKSTQVENILNSQTIKEQTEDMKIAWRYENINYTNLIGELSKTLKYIFDLSRPLQDNYLKNIKDNNLLLTKYINFHEENSYLKIINQIITDFQSLNNESNENGINYNRIVLTNFFGNMDLNKVNLNEVNASLLSLKNMCRSINGYTIITVNKNFVNSNYIELLESISDYILRIKPLIMINDKEKVGSYDALLHIDKYNSINNIKKIDIETDVFGLIKDKRKIIIEKIDIGVEIDRNTKVKECELMGNINNSNNKNIDF